MSETQTPDSSGLKASKDKCCPYCGQAFTSSSLGRHLDLYIKEKNPKPPDGIHDVDQIRRMRGTITRRQPRNSIGGRRDISTPVGTPRSTLKSDVDMDKGTGIPKDGQYAVDSALSRYPFGSRWEVTGVINDLSGKPWESEDAVVKQPRMQRSVSKQASHKAQFDVKQKLSDAMDTARAAELALRELLGSWRAAKQHIENNSMPFEFDPLSLDFPALTLQCLKPPPTLFSSTQHPTSTSWSVQSPGQREFTALKTFFDEEFRRWKVACAVATTARTEELMYPPERIPNRDPKDAVRRAEKAAESLEKQVEEHLQSAYAVWETLPVQRQQELWVLELARGVGRKHKEAEKMKEEQHRLRQENTNLKSQIDQLNRLQQPREYKLLTPATIPVDRETMSWAYEQGVKGGQGIGFNLEDRHEDLPSVVTKSIERWKNVITSTRVSSGGMSAQKSLDQVPTTNGNGPSQSRASSQAATPQQPQARQLPKRSSTTNSMGQVSEQTGSSIPNTGPPSLEEASDQDADAEMEDDDSFALMPQSPIKAMVPSSTTTLEVPRQRAPMQQNQLSPQATQLAPQQTQLASQGLSPQQQRHAQQQRNTADPRFIMPNDAAAAGSPRAAINLSRSMPNINMTLQGGMHTDMGMAMQGVRQDMYME